LIFVFLLGTFAQLRSRKIANKGPKCLRNLYRKDISGGELIGLGFHLLVGYSIQVQNPKFEYTKGMLLISIIEALQLIGLSTGVNTNPVRFAISILSGIFTVMNPQYRDIFSLPLLHFLLHCIVSRMLRQSVTFGESQLMAVLGTVALIDFSKILSESVMLISYVA
jgi:hypothetical protein